MKFRTSRRINFYDCDPAAIMFYGKAFYLIHSAYEELIASQEIEDYWTSEDFVVPITKASTDFFLPLIAGDEIVIEVSVSQLREHSFELYYECVNAEGDKLFSSRTVHVFASREFTKVKIPEEIRLKLSQFSVD